MDYRGYMVMRRTRFLVIVVVILLCGGGAIGYAVCTRGVRVVVRNTGQERMRDVTIHVTGRMYALGDLAPGNSGSQRVSPTGESSVEIEFTDEQGQRVRLGAVGYLEPGYRGQIEMEIQNGKASAVKDEIQISIY